MPLVVKRHFCDFQDGEEFCHVNSESRQMTKTGPTALWTYSVNVMLTGLEGRRMNTVLL